MEAFCLEIDSSHRLCVAHRPRASSAPRGGVLFIHPLAEEMNKSRRTVAQAARALANDGWDVLQVDLFGCGDSAGDFSQATWETWLRDARIAYELLREKHGAQLWLWGLRTGCLLASALAQEAHHARGLLLWQPVVSGRQALQQLLRLHLLREALGRDARTGGTAALRAELYARGTIEIGGYVVSNQLASGLERAELSMPPASSRAVWLEVSLQEDADPSPVAAAHAARWREGGVRVDLEVVAGLQFWQTQEITECPGLVSKTRELLAEAA